VKCKRRNQQRPHAVVRETLPHFGKEEHVEALRVADEFGFAADRHHCPDCQESPEHDNRDYRDPVALIPERKIFQRHSPKNLQAL
jgi:hypothetical protein